MIGEQFGNYRAISLLGEGGMGAVYLAEHPGIGRRVAVKVLHREYTSDEQLLGRLLNEARAANAIRHPNIIEILDSGMRPDGTPYLVMELLEGESLGGRIRRLGRMPIRDVLQFTYQTASALGAAHKKGIIHRDLKPDNLFIVSDPLEPGRERIKVLDFGIAKLQQPQPGDSVKTRTGTLMGTPIYMSPEQCRGTRTVDHRSDVYSLGVIVFEMLVGKPPFMSEGFGDLVNMHLNVPPPSPRTARPELSDAMDALVLRMLAKNPDERHPDMTALQGALKVAAGTLVTSLGSSPDILNAPTESRGRVESTGPRVGGTIAQTQDTTFSTGVGEREPLPRTGGTRGRLAAAVGLVVALGGGALLLMRGGGDKKTDEPSTATTALEAPAAPTAALPTPTPPPPAEPAKVTLRLASVPDGATVTDAAGDLLGTTPFALERRRGGALKLRFEKDGFAAASREVPLDASQDLRVTLEKKSKPRPPSHRPRDTEPAKL